MSLLPPHKIFIAQSAISRDIDHLSELAKPWNLHLRKMDKGNHFIGKVDQIAAEDFLIFKADFSGVLEQKGAPPEGMRTFWIPVDDVQFFFLRNINITGNTIGFFPLGSELDAVTKPGFKTYVISVPEKHLVARAFKMGMDWSIIRRTNRKDHVVLDSQKVHKLRNKIVQLFKLRNSMLIPKDLNIAFEDLKNSLLDDLVTNCLQIHKEFKTNPSNRLRIFKQFKDFVYSDSSLPFISSELCSLTGASERTLQYTIKDFTGLTPAQYYKAVKLSFVRDRLLKSDSGNTKINQLACEFGFWHTAQFATDYRKQFGELPSDTLKYKVKYS